jgi:hypothetical protein
MKVSDEMVEQLARDLCALANDDPDRLEPGSAYVVDGLLPNGDPAFRRWRLRAADARSILETLVPAIRTATLEEAARVAEKGVQSLCIGTPGHTLLKRAREAQDYASKRIAAAIRALKDKPHD